MSTARRGVALLGALALAAGCSRVPVDRLYALRLDAAPGRSTWRSSLPLPLKSGGGNLNGPNRRLAELALDTDAVHGASASCHHGPPVTAPVHLQARAFYTDAALHVEVQWEDPTPDTRPRAWRRVATGGGQEWRLEDADEDGVAILWTRSAGPYGCQEACHMRDFSLRQGELVDLRAMVLADEADWEETWVWKPAGGAQALTLGSDGFRTAAGELYRSVNSAVGADERLRPEARRAGMFGPADRPLRGAGGGPLEPGATEAPAWVYGARGDGGGLTATAERVDGGWRVVFTRALAAGERRQSFLPGGSYRFGLAVFDATSTNHHIVRDTQTLQLVPARAPSPDPEAEAEEGGPPRAGGAS